MISSNLDSKTKQPSWTELNQLRNQTISFEQGNFLVFILCNRPQYPCVIGRTSIMDLGYANMFCLIVTEAVL